MRPVGGGSLRSAPGSSNSERLDTGEMPRPRNIPTSRTGLRSDEPASKVCAEVIHHGHDQIEGEKQREQAVFQKEADGDLDLLAQAAGPDISQDDRLPDVDLPPVERVGRKIRNDLGEDAVEKDWQPGGAGRLQRVDGLGLDILGDLPEKPSQDPASVNPQGQH